MNHAPKLVNLQEILFCRGSIAALFAESTRNADGHAVVRWNSDDLVPPKSRDVCLSALATTAAASGIDEALFSIAVQTQTTDGAHGKTKVYGGLVLLLSTDERAQVARARAAASAFAAALGTLLELPGAAQTSPAGSVELAASSSEPLTVDDLVAASFLGSPLQVPLDLLVPGHAGYRVQGRFKRRSGRGFTTRKLSIRGHLRWVKVGGKTNRVFVSAKDLETQRPFGNHPILFDNKFRDCLAQSLKNPGAPLQLMLVEQRLDDGRSRPRTKYMVESVELAQPNDSRDDTRSIRDHTGQPVAAPGAY